MTDPPRRALTGRTRRLVAVGCSVAVAAVASIWLAVGGSTGPSGPAGGGGAPAPPGHFEPGGGFTGRSLPPVAPTHSGRADAPPGDGLSGAGRDDPLLPPGDGVTAPGGNVPELPPGGSGSPRPRRPAAPPPGAAPGREPAPAPPASDNGESATPADLFTRTDPPPDGVAAQLEGFVGGIDNGDVVPPSAGPVITVPEVVEIPSDATLRFWNFDLLAPLTVTVTDPAGSAETLVLDPPDADYFQVARSYLPGRHAVGDYVVRARQGGRAAALTYPVRRAAEPRMLISPPSGRAFLHLGGFPARQGVAVHMYGGTPEETADHLPYRATFVVPVDAVGEARIRLRVRPGTPAGCFAFTAAGMQGAQVEFCT